MSAPDISDGTADQQIASYVDRILRLKDEQDGTAGAFFGLGELRARASRGELVVLNLGDVR